MKKEIQNIFKMLDSLPFDSDGKGKRQRGRDFEKLLRLIFENENLEPVINLRPKGEEIDGSFILSDKIYLLEAKWHSKELPASSIYAFKGKVDGKLIGTIGVFISISGFSKDAVDALTLGKSLNTILFDKEDIEFCIEEGNSFIKGLKKKLRIAAEKGVVYYPLKSRLLKINKTNNSLDSKVIETESSNQEETLTIICEGQSDRAILQGFISKIIGRENSNLSCFEITIAHGKYSAPKLANVMLSFGIKRQNLIVVMDGDNNIDGTKVLFLNVGIDAEKIIIPNPSIETWLGMDIEQSSKDFYRQNSIRKNDFNSFLQIIDNLDIEELSNSNNEFKRFKEIITGHNIGS